MLKELKESLLKEQGFICCYCQIGLIGNPHNNTHADIVVEHLLPKSIYPAKIFDYDNLLLSCNGGKENIEQPYESRPKCCDYHKSDELIPISRLDSDCEDFFDYYIDFSTAELQILMAGITADAQKTIEVLNLNVEQLKNKRGAYISGFILAENGDYISQLEAQELLAQLKEAKPYLPFHLVLIKILENNFTS
jgi:uncharacterized protein (TIGR02646 family)